ncbi:NAD(+) diphosphatase [Aestuariivirga litoralis]|uniref:NAD(+) diphosphatase n=1 Tax=Aestuariivirga litoralis TaxID=2650924 RepID=A0A2W2BER2_9HYPH|nr:NAD(+) diphosphatase [Aestuariivirga litoralis]PZF78698.1 NAD(+) diphosphatase [Aestuariivirga litoralis]
MTLAYVLNPLDRRANDRPNAGWIAERRQRADARLIRIAGDAALLQDGTLVTANDVTAEPSVFLGLDASGAPWFACRVPATDGMRDLRSLAMEEALPPEQLGMLAQARSLLQWHERRTYCSNCAAKLELADAGYRRHCPSCGMDHFPRTDPVVIMVVRHQGSILLGRQSSWKPGMYSALAGFVEPGETIEDAARREVFEESGVRVGPVRYVTSQPWPFLSNLMIGLVGDAVSAEITIDRNELEDARWFSADEARMMVERRHPDGLYAANPYAIAHELVRVALEG